MEQTVESIHEVAPADADRYRAWMAATMPIITVLRAGVEVGAQRRGWRLPVRAWAAGQALARNGGPWGLAQLHATHRSNAVQMLVLLATTDLPGYLRGIAPHVPGRQPGPVGLAASHP